ncbi:MAG: PqqD family protein [Acidobacteriota bacterium]|nr:PqqD family protein [Acidobacteriota bacterium]
MTDGRTGEKSAKSFRLRSDVRYRVVSGQAVIIAQDAGEAIVLNEIGTRVLELIAEGLSDQDIVDALDEEFEGNRVRIRADVTDYLTDLIEAGLIEEVEPAAPSD